MEGREPMMWERNRAYKGRKCIVCGLKTNQLVAPIGIASGSLPCHTVHPDKMILDAYVKWAASLQAYEERSS